MWRQISSCEGKLFPVTGIVFIWQEISSCDRKFLPAIQNSFLWHNIPYCNRKFLHPSSFFPMTVIFFLFSVFRNTAKIFSINCCILRVFNPNTPGQLQNWVGWSINCNSTLPHLGQSLQRVPNFWKIPKFGTNAKTVQKTSRNSGRFLKCTL